MAITYPASPTFQTRGEKQVFTFLKNSLSNAWHLFYEPHVDDVTPDIVVFSPYAGALIIEVKDYATQTIKRLSPNYWELSVEGQTKSILSPYEQVRHYKHKLAKQLEKRNGFCVREGIYQGKVMFPIMCACWLVNITEHDIGVMGISKVIPDKLLLTKDRFEQPHVIEDVLYGILASKFKINEVSTGLTNELVQFLHPSLSVPEYEEIRKAWFRTFQSNILTFASVVDEVLFIATEIRHLRAKGVSDASISIFVQENRHLKRNSILFDVEHILADMGVNGVRIGALNDYLTPDRHTYTFVMDLKPTGMDEKKEASLSELLREASGRVWFTSSCLE
ncbi:NERD domain-containing protein [Paenibacillus aurantiacus]|uniref:NERD domain-containing protein n=1 Tax=Paenibacillus aurantiacus TaxID=1936118 RepID=A0ABV5KJ59_9BACL